MDKYILFQYVEDSYDKLSGSKLLGPVNNDNLDDIVNELIDYLDFTIFNLHDYNQVVEEIIINIKNTINAKNISKYINDDGIYSLYFNGYSKSDACINFIPVNMISKIEIFASGIGSTENGVSIIDGPFACKIEEKEKRLVYMYYEYKRINNAFITKFKVIGIYDSYSNEIKDSVLKEIFNKSFIDKITFNKIKDDNMKILFNNQKSDFISYKKDDIFDPSGFFMVLRAVPLNEVSKINYTFNSKGDLS